jgi:hypothetical protein
LLLGLASLLLASGAGLNPHMVICEQSKAEMSSDSSKNGWSQVTYKCVDVTKVIRFKEGSNCGCRPIKELIQPAKARRLLARFRMGSNSLSRVGLKKNFDAHIRHNAHTFQTTLMVSLTDTINVGKSNKWMEIPVHNQKCGGNMHDSCITTKIENPYDFQYLQGAPASQPRF